MKKGTIYFLRSERLGLVKIGITNSLERRIAQLQSTSGDLSLVGCIDGAPAIVERALHYRFCDKRAFGEWFALTDDPILKVIQDYYQEPARFEKLGEEAAVFYNHTKRPIRNRAKSLVGSQLWLDLGIPDQYCEIHTNVLLIQYCPACRGAIKTPSKSAASRRNGMLGGRPKKGKKK